MIGRKTRIVTFPRSGHHWLVNGLIERYGIKYDEHHATGNTLENSDCDFQKTHDFALDVFKNPEYNHIIQIRNPLKSIQSWYKLLNSETPFQAFLEEKMAFYQAWFYKWVTTPTPNSMVICYEDMLKDYEEKLESVWEFVAGPSK